MLPPHLYPTPVIVHHQPRTRTYLLRRRCGPERQKDAAGRQLAGRSRSRLLLGHHSRQGRLGDFYLFSTIPTTIVGLSFIVIRRHIGRCLHLSVTMHPIVRMAMKRSGKCQAVILPMATVLLWMPRPRLEIWNFVYKSF
jgi:hypothetical protein